MLGTDCPAIATRRWRTATGPNLGFLPRRAALGLAPVVLAIGLATPATADAAYSIGPLSLFTGNGSVPAVQVPSTSLLSYSFGITGGGASKGWGGGGYAPKSAATLTITKRLDEFKAPLLAAALKGEHFKKVELTIKQSVTQEHTGQVLGICLTDAFISSYRLGGSYGDSGQLEETLGFVYEKAKYLTVAAGQSPCTGSPPPPVETSLLGVRGHGSSVLARVDCLSPRCRGILTVSLPPAACRLGETLCSFTGGVRVGLNGSGKIYFNGNGTATLNGGTKVGISGTGSFSMGDGSVKILRLSVPSPLRKWLAGHSHALLGAIIVVRGSSTAIVEHEVLGAPAKLPAGAPSGTLEEPPGGGPTDLPQTLSFTGCEGAHPVGTPPTVVVVSGSVAPARSSAKVTLTYTPVSGPPPLPSPIVDSVTTDAAGNFGENFDREQGGQPYSWNVVASIAEGDGYAAAQSPACAIPIP